MQPTQFNDKMYNLNDHCIYNSQYVHLSKYANYQTDPVLQQLKQGRGHAGYSSKYLHLGNMQATKQTLYCINYRNTREMKTKTVYACKWTTCKLANRPFVISNNEMQGRQAIKHPLMLSKFKPVECHGENLWRMSVIRNLWHQS